MGTAWEHSTDEALGAQHSQSNAEQGIRTGQGLGGNAVLGGAQVTVGLGQGDEAMQARLWDGHSRAGWYTGARAGGAKHQA